MPGSATPVGPRGADERTKRVRPGRLGAGSRLTPDEGRSGAASDLGLAQHPFAKRLDLGPLAGCSRGDEAAAFGRLDLAVEHGDQGSALQLPRDQHRAPDDGSDSVERRGLAGVGEPGVEVAAVGVDAAMVGLELDGDGRMGRLEAGRSAHRAAVRDDHRDPAAGPWRTGRLPAPGPALGRQLLFQMVVLALQKGTLI